MQVRAACAVVLGLLTTACHVPAAELGGRATDEWVRSYTLSPGGEIQVSGANGTIDLEGHDGAAVEVRAERSVHAASDAAAMELVSRIVIQEDVAPDRVSIRTEGISGILLGVSYSVKYRVRAPRAVVARMRVTNGDITAKGFAGHLIATSTNGSVVGDDLDGRVEARSTNGHVRVSMKSVGQEGINIRTTNGRVELVLPESARADISATCRNGSIQVTGLEIEPDGDQSSRSVQGRLNGGGAPIELITTNGRIRIRSQTSEP